MTIWPQQFRNKGHGPGSIAACGWCEYSLCGLLPASCHINKPRQWTSSFPTSDILLHVNSNSSSCGLNLHNMSDLFPVYNLSLCLQYLPLHSININMNKWSFFHDFCFLTARLWAIHIYFSVGMFRVVFAVKHGPSGKVWNQIWCRPILAHFHFHSPLRNRPPKLEPTQLTQAPRPGQREHKSSEQAPGKDAHAPQLPHLPLLEDPGPTTAAWPQGGCYRLRKVELPCQYELLTSTHEHKRETSIWSKPLCFYMSSSAVLPVIYTE